MEHEKTETNAIVKREKLQKRRIVLDDGRYLIFFTASDEANESKENEQRLTD